MEKEKDKSCKTPRWRMLKGKLNNLSAKEFLSVPLRMVDAVIIDVRTSKEFEVHHISNALNLDFFSDDFWEKMEKMDPSKKYFVYCRSGRRSIRVCTWMGNGGFDVSKIYNLDRGYGELLKEFPDALVS